MLLRMRSQTLMVRTAARPRVSNHEARWMPDDSASPQPEMPKSCFCSRLLPARKKLLEGGHCLVGAHAFAEQMALLVDPAGQDFWRRPQQLGRGRYRARRQRTDL